MNDSHENRSRYHPEAALPIDDSVEMASDSLADLPETGDRQVDEALEPLVGVLDLSLTEQVAVYVGAHRALQERLVGLDS